MKKLLGVSIAAMLAVSPMLASADPITQYVEPAAPTQDNAAVTATNSPKYAGSVIVAADKEHIASTAYVKGAYNSAIAAINKVSETASSNLGTALSEAGGDGIAWNGTTSQFDVDLASNKGLNVDAQGKLETVVGDGIKVGSNGIEVDLTSNGGLQVDSTNHTLEVKTGDGITNTANGVAVDLYTGANDAAASGLEISSNKLKAKVDGTTVGINASGALEVKDGDATHGLTVAKFNTGSVVTSSDTLGSIGENGTASDEKLVTEKTLVTALQASGGIDTAQLADEAVTTAKIDDEAVTTAKIDDGAVTFVKMNGAAVIDSTETLGTGGANGTASDSALVTAKATANAIEGSANTATYSSSTNYTAGTVGAELKSLNAKVVTIYSDWNDSTATEEVGFGDPTPSI